MGAQGRRRLSGVGRGASVSLTDRRKQLSGMDAAQIEGHHLWREFLGAVPIKLLGNLTILDQKGLKLIVQQEALTHLEFYVGGRMSSPHFQSAQGVFEERDKK